MSDSSLLISRRVVPAPGGPVTPGKPCLSQLESARRPGLMEAPVAALACVHSIFIHAAVCGVMRWMVEKAWWEAVSGVCSLNQNTPGTLVRKETSEERLSVLIFSMFSISIRSFNHTFSDQLHQSEPLATC